MCTSQLISSSSGERLVQKCAAKCGIGTARPGTNHWNLRVARLNRMGTENSFLHHISMLNPWWPTWPSTELASFSHARVFSQFFFLEMQPIFSDFSLSHKYLAHYLKPEERLNGGSAENPIIKWLRMLFYGIRRVSDNRIVRTLKFHYYKTIRKHSFILWLNKFRAYQ